MKVFSAKRRFLGCVCILFFGLFMHAKAGESERIYSLAEVTAIDQENKLWRLVDPTEAVEVNVQRLLAAGFSVAEVETFKPHLIALSSEIDPSLQIDWLGEDIVQKIQELKSEYEIPMIRARIGEAIYRLGGAREPTEPDQIKTRFRDAIWSLLDLDQRDEFTLMNSPPAIALCRLVRDLPTTASERLALCRLQQEFANRFQTAVKREKEIPQLQIETLLAYWQQMRDFLGDERFRAYMESSDAGFGQMSLVLGQIPGVNSAKILDLWWARKRDELEDVRLPWKISWLQRKIETNDSAKSILGEQALKVYRKDEDAKWLNVR